MDDDTDYRDFQEKLKDFPHTFQLENYRRMSREKYKVILRRLRSEQETFTHAGSIMEEVRDHNFLSFLCFIVDEKVSATNENEIAREKDPDNIVALANYVHMLYLEGHVEEIDDMMLNLNRLKKQEDFRYKLVSAKAELAYNYNRMGPSFGEKSVHCYKEVIDMCDYPEKSHIFVWKFGASLAMRRHYKRTRHGEYTKKASEYLKQITDECDDPTLVAKSWIEIAENHGFERSNPESKQQIVDYLEKALDLCSTEAFILERCGKFYRYLGDLEKSQYYLEKAISIRPTTFSYEHLALTFFENAKQTQRMKDLSESECCLNVDEYILQNLDSGFESDVRGALPANLMADTGPLIEQTTEGSLFTAVDTGSPVSHLDQHVPQPSESDCSDHQLHIHTTDAQQSQLNPNATPFYPSNYQETYLDDLNSLQIHRSYSVGETTNESFHFTNSKEYGHSMISVNDSSNKYTRKRPFIKSPITCIRLPKDDPNVVGAIHNFLKSLEISGYFNQSSFYELGILYRSIGDFDNGIVYFRKLLSVKGSHRDHQMMINAYEQIGQCYLDKADITTDSEEKLRLKKESQKMLTKAVEVCARQAAGTCLTVASLPTLRDLLCDDQQATPTTKNLLELARLHSLVGRYRESLDFYHMLFEEDVSTAKTPHTAVSVVENFLKGRDYQGAAVFLDILMCTEEGKSLAKEKDLISRLYKESVLHYMNVQDFLSSQSCFQSAFLYRYGRLAFDKDGVWDVVFLDDPDVNCPQTEYLMKLLDKMCGLQTTKNTDDALGGIPELRAQTDIIEKSTCVVILVGKKELSRHFESNATMAAEMLNREKTSSVVLVTVDMSFVPSYLCALPCKEYRDMPGGVVVNKEDRLWLLDLFQKLINVK